MTHVSFCNVPSQTTPAIPKSRSPRSLDCDYCRTLLAWSGRRVEFPVVSNGAMNSNACSLAKSSFGAEERVLLCVWPEWSLCCAVCSAALSSLLFLDGVLLLHNCSRSEGVCGSAPTTVKCIVLLRCAAGCRRARLSLQIRGF